MRVHQAAGPKLGKDFTPELHSFVTRVTRWESRDSEILRSSLRLKRMRAPKSYRVLPVMGAKSYPAPRVH